MWGLVIARNHRILTKALKEWDWHGALKKQLTFELNVTKTGNAYQKATLNVHTQIGNNVACSCEYLSKLFPFTAEPFSIWKLDKSDRLCSVFLKVISNHFSKITPLYMSSTFYMKACHPCQDIPHRIKEFSAMTFEEIHMAYSTCSQGYPSVSQIKWL